MKKTNKTKPDAAAENEIKQPRMEETLQSEAAEDV